MMGQFAVACGILVQQEKKKKKKDLGARMLHN